MEPPMTPDAAELSILSQFTSGFWKIPFGAELESAPARLALMRCIGSGWLQLCDISMDARRMPNGIIQKLPHRVFMLTPLGIGRLGQLRVGAKG